MEQGGRMVGKKRRESRLVSWWMAVGGGGCRGEREKVETLGGDSWDDR